MILLFLKSIIIGIANIIPGVSGGTLAVMLNVYDPITEKIGNFFLVDRKTKLSYFLVFIYSISRSSDRNFPICQYY